MQRFLTTLATLLAAMLLGNGQAQQATTPKAQTAPKASEQQTPAKRPASAAPTSKTESSAALKTDKEKFSYALGMNLGSGLHKQGVEIDSNLFARGVKDAIEGGKTLLTQEEAQAMLMAKQSEIRQKQQEKMQQAGEANKKEGEAFLAANKGKEGVAILPSGLEYKILKQGSGPKPAATDTVVCNYRGTLINGTEFDSSYKRGQPAEFPVSGVIRGWTEALQLMPVGSKWQLFVPSSLAYGERGAGGGDIGPNETLIFEVELLSIKPKESNSEKKETAPDKK